MVNFNRPVLSAGEESFLPDLDLDRIWDALPDIGLTDFFTQRSGNAARTSPRNNRGPGHTHRSDLIKTPEPAGPLAPPRDFNAVAQACLAKLATVPKASEIIQSCIETANKVMDYADNVLGFGNGDALVLQAIEAQPSGSHFPRPQSFPFEGAARGTIDGLAASQRYPSISPRARNPQLAAP